MILNIKSFFFSGVQYRKVVFFWYVMIYPDISRYIQIYHDISWYVKIYRDIYWYLVIQISWYINDISRYIMIYPDISSTFFLKKSGFVKKNIEKYHDISEKYHDISWYIVIYRDISWYGSSTYQWHIMIYHDISRCITKKSKFDLSWPMF